MNNTSKTFIAIFLILEILLVFFFIIGEVSMLLFIMLTVSFFLNIMAVRIGSGRDKEKDLY